MNCKRADADLEESSETIRPTAIRLIVGPSLDSLAGAGSKV